MGIITTYGQRLLPKSWRPIGAGIYWAILNPHMDLSMEKTFEEPTITSPEERERLFG
jgi:hypothetical protein